MRFSIVHPNLLYDTIILKFNWNFNAPHLLCKKI